MVGNSMGNFMAHNSRYSSISLTDRENSRINGDFSAGHAECIFLFTVYQIELPLKAFNVFAVAVLAHISFYGPGQLLSDISHTISFGRAFYYFSFFQELVLLGLTHLRSEEHTSELQSLMRISYAV